MDGLGLADETKAVSKYSGKSLMCCINTMAAWPVVKEAELKSRGLVVQSSL